MNYTKYFAVLSIAVLMSTAISVHAQLVPTPNNSGAVRDTSQKVTILNYTKKLTFQTIDDSTKLTIIVGDVKLKQNNTLFYCDSCIINSRTNIFEAWGRQVHINDSDTTDVFANHLRYLTKDKIAYLDGNAKLTDGNATLTTPDLVYDMQTNIGTYTNGGKVVNKKSVLTSKEGFYYADLKDVYFKKNVVLNDPAYNIVTDSLLYNTATQTTRFISQTMIKDSSGRIIRTKEGYYNQQTGKAEFGQGPEIIDGDISIKGRRIAFDDSTGIYQAEGNAVVFDKKNNTTIIGGLIYQNKKTDAVLATRKPLMIITRDNDSTYITADTLFSAKLSDRFRRDSVGNDTVKGVKTLSLNKKAVKDSTDRYFEGYSHVRIFNDSLQSVADSMFYSFKDSVFRLYKHPVVWANSSQVTGDTIHLYTKNKKPDHVEAFENGFMINRVQDDVFNQVKSSRIDGWFLDGNIDSVRANGSAECIYYIQDEDSAYTGVNESKSDIMDFYFVQKQLDRVVMRSSVIGTIWPIRDKTPGELQLTDFRWLEERRPKTKFEMFE